MFSRRIKPPFGLQSASLVRLLSILVLFSLLFWIRTAVVDSLQTVDFMVVYTGWRMVVAGERSQLYDIATQIIYQQQLLQNAVFQDGLLPFNTPPITAMLGAPLGMLPFTQAYLAWTGVQLVLLGLLFRWIWRYTSEWHAGERWILMAAVAGCCPLLATMIHGAFSLASLVSLLYWSEAIRTSRAQAGVWILLSVSRPQYLLLPSLITLLARRWQALIWLIGGGLIIWLSSSLLFGWHIWLDWATMVRQTALWHNQYGIYPASMHNLRSLLTLLLDPQQIPLLQQISGIGFVAAYGLIAWLWRHPAALSAADRLPRLAFSVSLAVFCMPHLYLHDTLVMVAPCIWLYTDLRQSDPDQAAWFATFCLVASFFVMVTEIVIKAMDIYQEPVHLGAVTIIILIGWSALRLRSYRYPIQNQK